MFNLLTVAVSKIKNDYFTTHGTPTVYRNTRKKYFFLKTKLVLEIHFTEKILKILQFYIYIIPL